MKAGFGSSYLATSFLLIILFGFAVCIVYLLRSRLIINRPVAKLDDVASFTAFRENGEFSIVGINWPVSIQAGMQAVSGVIDSISFSNAFVVCRHPLPINSPCRLEIHVPDGQSIHTEGQVTWSNAAISHRIIKKRGMGIRFLRLADRDRQLLRSFSSAPS